MSGANASPTGRSHQGMTGANASPVGRSHQRITDRFLAGTIVLVLLIPAGASAQTKPATKTPAAGWTKKTPDGHPDLQGFWSSQTTAPLERDLNCGTKEFWTDEEMAKGTRTCARPD